jgi:putative MATE family efflux protein
MAFIIGIIMCALFNVFLEPLCKLFGATEEILPYALDYGRIISFGVLFSTLDSGLSGLIRADGSPKYSMVGLLIGCITNIICDPIFIFAFRWGVKGAAFATILGQILNAIWYLGYIRKFKSIKLDKTCFALSGAVVKKICALGISSFITQIAMVVVMAVVNNVLVYYGAKSVYGAEIPLTTLGITLKVNQIITAVIVGLAVGAQPIFGYNYGCGQIDRVKQTYRIVLVCATAMLVFAFCVFQSTPMSIVRLFGSESDLYNEFAVKCFRIFLLLCPIMGVQMVTGIFFQAIGKPVQSSILSLSRQILYLIPASLLLPLALGVEGVLWAGPIADFLAFLTALTMLKIYWKKL